MIKLHHGDSLEILKDIPENSVHSIVTDPPAGINFMGKSWDDYGTLDNFQQAMFDIFTECYRVIKPGGYGFVWALPRTSHHTAMALEKCGFDIRDVVTHLFGSGFPKSHNVSKAFDKMAGAERDVVGLKEIAKPDSDCWGTPNKNKDAGGFGQNDTCFSNDKEEWSIKNNPITAPSTDLAKKWDGYGTALKPANEHWILIRKPLSEKTVCKNIIKHGVGALNIDACRVENLSKEAKKEHERNCNRTGGSRGGFMVSKLDAMAHTQGRFPANIIHDASPVIEEKFLEQGGKPPIVGSQRGSKFPSKVGGFNGSIGKNIEKTCHAPVDNPVRFFNSLPITELDAPFLYQSKASKKDRNSGGTNNIHPTCKSTNLMSWLIKLVTPHQGTTLDPFMGSGTSGIAAKINNFSFIGIEREEEYFKIAKQRIYHAG